MAGWNGAGVFVRLYSWVADSLSPATNHIDPTKMDAEFNLYKTGLENCITRDGQNTPSADLPMGAHKHTGVTDGSASGHYASWDQLQTEITNRTNAIAAITSFPAGTRMPFAQASAPTGWTQDTSATINNRMMRIVNVAGGTTGSGGTGGSGYGGTDTPISMNKVISHTHTYSGNTGGQSANHTHNIGQVTNLAAGASPVITAGSGGTAVSSVENATHTHAFSGTTTAPAGAVSAWSPQYYNLILCVKN